MVSAKVATRTKERLDNYANEEGISRSQAIGRMLKQGLDVEESDMRLVPVRSDGGTVIEDRLDEIQRNQQDRLDEIDQKVESLDDDPSRIKEILDQIVLWSFGLTMTGGITGLLASLGILSMGTSVIVPFTLLSGLIFGVSNLIRDSVYGEEGPL